jgi:hypothetical protein
MTTEVDIVTRLRDYHPAEQNIDLSLLLFDAANKIESLRHDRDNWHQAAVNIAQWPKPNLTTSIRLWYRKTIRR